MLSFGTAKSTVATNARRHSRGGSGWLTRTDNRSSAIWSTAAVAALHPVDAVQPTSTSREKSVSFPRP